MAFRLQDFAPDQRPPSLVQRDTSRDRADIRIPATLEQTQLRRRFQTRTLPDFLGGQAARGAFQSGATQRGAQRGAEDVLDQQARIEFDVARQMEELQNRQLLPLLGIQL